MRRMRVVLSILGLAFLSGCVFLSGAMGDRFTSEVVQNIQAGRTTKQEVVGFLGEPTLQIPLANGRERYVYHFSNLQGSNINFIGNFTSVSQRSEMLDVVFRGEVVESHQHIIPKAEAMGGR
jgi:outer membrane protein assembly factor BamE (lipoprotein component of BamABCDE complex)